MYGQWDKICAKCVCRWVCGCKYCRMRTLWCVSFSACNKQGVGVIIVLKMVTGVDSGGVRDSGTALRLALTCLISGVSAGVF
jgi:hypothetical protein